MNSTIALAGMVITGLWAIGLWTARALDYDIDLDNLDEDF
jgi:hypothetical protein